MDHNQINIKLPKGGYKRNKSPHRQGKSNSEGRRFTKYGKKDKELLRTEKSSSRNKSPNRRPQKENLKKDLKSLTQTLTKAATKSTSTKEEKKEINEVLKDDDAEKLVPYEVKLRKAKSSSNLEKRTLDTFLSEGKTFLKFGGDADEDNEVIEKKKEDLESIDNMFGELKKVKRDNYERRDFKGKYQGTKEILDPELEKKKTQQAAQLKSAEPPFEEMEKAYAPWMSGSTSKIENPLIRLHNEILDFVEFVGPSKKDEATRRKSFDK